MAEQEHGNATIDPELLKAHPRDLHLDAAGKELWELIQAWRAKWQPTRVEYLWQFNAVIAMELRKAGREERDALDKKSPV